MRFKVIPILPDDAAIVAPCGINCSLCRAYLRARSPCPGCRADDANKSRACLDCPIKNCSELATQGLRFCSRCAKFPCAALRHLDQRYRHRYHVSPLANLARIESEGLGRFIADERSVWTCSACGAGLSMHKPTCPQCGHARPAD